MRKALVDTDKLNSVGLRAVGNSTMAIADAIQGYSNEQQVVATAAFFIMLCKSFKVNAADMFNTAERVIRFAHKDRPELLAAQQYIDGELK